MHHPLFNICSPLKITVFTACRTIQQQLGRKRINTTDIYGGVIGFEMKVGPARKFP